jgi:hypothetical protein
MEDITKKFQYFSTDYILNYCNKTNLEIRNNFTDDLYIVVIGHLRHLNDLIIFYKGLKNVIFVVDKTETENNINILKTNGFTVVVSDTPNFNGFGNVNFQCQSSIDGAKYVKSVGGKYMIRMRSDQIILQIQDFINNFNFDKLGFIAYFNQSRPAPDAYDFNGFNFNYFTKFNRLKSLENLNYCYLMDYCISGPVDYLIDIFDYYENKPIPAPAEHKLLMTYFLKKEMDYDNSFENIKKHFYLMCGTFVENHIDFIMIKQGYHNWTVAIPLQPNLYYY